MEPTINDNKDATGYLWDLSKTQYSTLVLFKEKIVREQLLSDFNQFGDDYLLRFLRARKFDIDKSFLMFSDFIKWRKENDVDNSENFDFSEIDQVRKYYPHGYHKTDKIGRPIYIERTGDFNLSELFKITTEDRMMKYYVKEYERLMKYRFPACSKAYGKLPIEQGFTILDLNGVGVSLLTPKVLGFLKIASNIAQNYYPEMLGTMILINTTFFFKAIWVIVRPFIDEKTSKKIIVEKSGFLKKLQEYVDMENIPSIFGGDCKCEQFGGCLWSDIGPWNPEGGKKQYTLK